MTLTRRTLLTGAATVAASGVFRGTARAQSDVVKIGVLTDFSGPYKDLTGPTSVACVQQAVAEFTAAVPSIKVEVVTADHQNKPDIASGIVREWFDRGGVDTMVDLGNSAVALACNGIAQQKDKVHLNTAAGASVLTGESCTPNLVHWTYDTWNLAYSTGTSVTGAGGTSWFFVAADYAFGRNSVRDATKFIEAAGGKVVNSVFFPFPGTTDFASYLLQGQASGANVIAFATGGADFVTFVKQAQEFGITRKGVRLVGMTGFITDIRSMTLQVAQGVTLSENFYWDLNDKTRAWFARVKPKLAASTIPNMIHAGNYSAALHYLKAVKELGLAQAKGSGRAAVAMMKKMPTEDDCYGVGSIREDGRKIHPAYLFEAKKPGESKEPGDLYKLVAIVPAEKAFRPVSEGGCQLVKR
jgi:branched-chain amino acid transport system substrate-binding protein